MVEVSQLEAVCREILNGKAQRQKVDPLEMIREWVVRGDAESFRLPELLKAGGWIVRMERSARERMARFELRNGEVEQARESVRTSFLALTRRLWPDAAKGKGETWRQAVKADSDRKAEAIFLEGRESSILDAVKQRDADFLIKLGSDLKALRRSRREQKTEPLPRLLLFLLANWDQVHEMDLGTGRVVTIPPLSMFADTALKNLVEALEFPAFNNKAVTRALSLKRLHAPLVRTVLVRGNILRLS